MADCADIEAIRQVLARYTRAADYRRAEDADEIFVPDATFEIAYNDQGTQRVMGASAGIEAARAGFARLPAPLGGGWGHHFTLDHIIEVSGDEAQLSAQFLTTSAIPDGSTPRGVERPAGTVMVGLTGYYDTTLRRVSNRWFITHHRVTLDLPYKHWQNADSDSR